MTYPFIMRPKHSLRVSAGSVKGQRLIGTLSVQARPTTERVKAAIFNIISERVYMGNRVLDLYAGSGSLGIEALSLGADWSDFVEKNNRQCSVIEGNLARTGFQERSKVYCGDSEKLLEALRGPYSLVLLDPPYKMNGLMNMVEKISQTPGLISEDSFVVVGHSRHVELPEKVGGLALKSHRKYGDNVVDFFGQGT